MTLVNLYGPNGADASFFTSTEAIIITAIGNASVVLCGDSNSALDQQLDTSGYLHNINI